MDTRSSATCSSLPECNQEDSSIPHMPYKRLVIQIADSLSSEHVEKIVFLYGLPDKMKQDTPLNVLTHLHQSRSSDFNERNTNELISLLKDIGQEKLIHTKVEPCCKQKFYGGRPPSHSMPYGAVNPRIPMERRPKSYYGQASRDYSIAESTPHQETVTNNLHSHPLKPDDVKEQTESLVSSSSHADLSVQAQQLHQTNLEHTHSIQIASDPNSSSNRVQSPTQSHGAETSFSLSSQQSQVRVQQQAPTMNSTYGHSSTQSLPQHSYDTPRQRHSTSCVETPQNTNHYQGQVYSSTGPLLQRPQSVTMFSPAGMPINEGTVFELRPLSLPPSANTHWYCSASSSTDSIQDHSTSYSSGFASSGEMYRPHHWLSGPAPRPGYSFKEKRCTFHDRCPSQEYFQASHQQSPGLDHQCYHSLSGSRLLQSNSQSPYGSSNPYTTEFQSASSTSSEFTLSRPRKHETVPHPQSTYTETEVPSCIPNDTSQSHLANRVSSSDLHSEDKQSDVVPQNVSATEATSREELCVETDQSLESHIGPAKVKRSPVHKRKQKEEKRKSASFETNFSRLCPDTQVQLRCRSFSFDQKPGRAKRRNHRLSLHSDQSSESTTTPQITYRHSMHYDTSDLSPVDSSPTNKTPNFQTTISESGRPEASFGASRVPKSYRPVFLTRLQTKSLKEVEWKEKVNDINKLIYDHKHIGKFLPCPWKIAVDGKDGLPGIKIIVNLHPYGLEEDENKYVTIEVVIELPKKHRLPSEAKLSIKALARSDKTRRQLGEKEAIANLNLSYFYIKGFISHEPLRESLKLYGNENVFVTVKTEMILQTTV